MIVETNGSGFTAFYSATNPGGTDLGINMFQDSLYMDSTYLYIGYQQPNNLFTYSVFDHTLGFPWTPIMTQGASMTGQATVIYKNNSGNKIYIGGWVDDSGFHRSVIHILLGTNPWTYINSSIVRGYSPMLYYKPVYIDTNLGDVNVVVILAGVIGAGSTSGIFIILDFNEVYHIE